jgi:hypothetical protein
VELTELGIRRVGKSNSCPGYRYKARDGLYYNGYLGSPDVAEDYFGEACRKLAAEILDDILKTEIGPPQLDDVSKALRPLCPQLYPSGQTEGQLQETLNRLLTLTMY